MPSRGSIGDSRYLFVRRINAAELTWFDRDWFRVGALDFVTTAAYMLITLVAITSFEELLLMVSAAASSRRRIFLHTVVLSVHAYL